jgi:hypothetical protein
MAMLYTAISRKGCLVKSKTYQTKYGGKKYPAQLKPGVDAEANHFFHVLIESFST